jgi:hypothetical protein
MSLPITDSMHGEFPPHRGLEVQTNRHAVCLLLGDVFHGPQVASKLEMDVLFVVLFIMPFPL